MASVGGESFARGSTLAIIGAGWKLVIQLISLVVLSRLVPPADFGAMAILLSIAAVALLLGDLGLSTAALRAPRITQQQKSNLFWINLATGVLLWGVAIALAPWVSAVFSTPSLLWGLPLTASTVFFVLLGAQARTEINRRSDFTSLTWIEALAGLVSVLVAIVLAWAQFGLLALIMQQVVNAAVASILFLVVARWIPSWPRRVEGMREFLGFGAFTFAAQSVTFISNNVDVWLVGRLWGMESLGWYNRAMQVAKLPVTQLLPPLTRVALPHLREIDPHSDDFSARIRRWRAGLTQPLVLGLALIAAAASPLVALVLGPAWEQSAALVPPLVVAGIFQVLGSPCYWVLLALGNARAVFYSELAGRLAMAAAMIAVAPLGVSAIAWAGAGGAALIWVMQSWWASRRTSLPFGADVALCVRYVVMAAVAFGSARILDGIAHATFGVENTLVSLAVLVAGWLLGVVLIAAILPAARRDVSQAIAWVRHRRSR